jgi:hypothetical protein
VFIFIGSCLSFTLNPQNGGFSTYHSLLKYASTRAEFDAILKGVPRQVGPDYEWIGGTQTAFNL